MGLVLLDQLWLKGPGTIARCCQFKRTGTSLHGFTLFAILAVGKNLLGQVRINLRLKGSLCKLFDQGRKDTVLASDRLTGFECFQTLFKIEFLCHCIILF